MTTVPALSDPEPIANETESGYARRRELVDQARAALPVPALDEAQTDLDGKPFCPTGSAQRYHDIGECYCRAELGSQEDVK